MRRAGLDYWHLVEVSTHADFAAFRAAQPRRLRLFSGTATQSYLDAAFAPGDALVFGRESTGLPPDLLAAHAPAFRLCH